MAGRVRPHDREGAATRVDQRRAETCDQGPCGLGDIQHIPRIKNGEVLEDSTNCPDRTANGCQARSQTPRVMT